MNQPLIALVFALGLGAFASSALAMSENEYKSERIKLKETYSYRFVECVKFAGKERRACESQLRTERNAALDKLEETYKRTKTS